MNTAGFVEINYLPTIIVATVCLALLVLVGGSALLRVGSTGAPFFVSIFLLGVAATTGVYLYSAEQAAPLAQERFEQALATEYGATSSLDYQSLIKQTIEHRTAFTVLTADGQEQRVMVTRNGDQLEFTQGPELLERKVADDGEPLASAQ